MMLSASGIIAFVLALYLFSWDSKNSKRRGHPALALLAARPSIDSQIEDERQPLFYAAWLLVMAGLAGIVVSADAFQVYRGLDIGTAKATPEERREVPHHLIDVVHPDETSWRQAKRKAWLRTAAVDDVAVFKIQRRRNQEAAKALVDRSVGAVGIDTASLDHGPSTDFLAHRVLLGADIRGFENVMNLGSLPPTGTEIIALPMKIAGGSGGPLRIIARVPGEVCRP